MFPAAILRVAWVGHAPPDFWLATGLAPQLCLDLRQCSFPCHIQQITFSQHNIKR